MKNMKTMTFKKLIGSISLMFMSLMASAQDGVEMADLMRSNGKIFVVVGVLLIIFLGLTSFMVILERKLSKLEKKASEK